VSTSRNVLEFNMQNNEGSAVNYLNTVNWS